MTRGKDGTIQYFITRHRRLPGVGLAKAGNWGGERFPDDASATAFARADAAGQPFVIDRQTI